MVLFIQVDILPAERESIFSDELRPSDPRNVGPCGGFSTQYACMCDYHGVPYRFVDCSPSQPGQSVLTPC